MLLRALPWFRYVSQLPSFITVEQSSRWSFISCCIQILSLSGGERITSIIPVSEFAEDQYLLMLTANGYIKKVSLSYFSSIRSTGIIAIQLVSLQIFCFKFNFDALSLGWWNYCVIFISWSSILTGQVPGDELKWVRLCTNDDLVAMASQKGMVILSSCETVSSITVLSILLPPSNFMWTMSFECFRHAT